MHILKNVSAKNVFLIFVVAISALAFVAVLSLTSNIPVENFTRDTAVIAGIHSLTGCLSNLGVLFWCASVTLCFFTSALCKRALHLEEAAFYLWSGLLTAILLFDDLYMFHDYLGPRYLGTNEKLLFVAYAFLTAAYLWSFRKNISHDPHASILIVSLIWFSTSVFYDGLLEGIMVSMIGSWSYFLEDSAKFLGIIHWCAFFALSGFYTLNKLQKTL